MPVRKVALPKSKEAYLPVGASAKHSLFAGTRLLQAGSVADTQEPVVGLVLTTGISTSKGALVSDILYPSKVQFKYDLEMPVVWTILLLYALVVLVIAIWFQLRAGVHISSIGMFLYGVFTVGQVINPLVPLSLVVGPSMSSQRLRGRDIWCIDSSRVAISGKVRVFCFDKTGTLTTESLSFLGVHEKSPNNNGAAVAFAPQPVISEIEQQPLSLAMRQALGSCHSISKYDDSFVGNQVEVNMFKSSGWELTERPGQLQCVRDVNGYMFLTPPSPLELLSPCIGFQ